jgi:hypothetical protein
MVLHARETAVPFYKKLGYTCIGESFIEATPVQREVALLD